MCVCVCVCTIPTKRLTDQSAGAVEYADCIFAKE